MKFDLFVTVHVQFDWFYRKRFVRYARLGGTVGSS